MRCTFVVKSDKLIALTQFAIESSFSSFTEAFSIGWVARRAITVAHFSAIHPIGAIQTNCLQESSFSVYIDSVIQFSNLTKDFIKILYIFGPYSSVVEH